jgi:hypothetical protein
MPCHCRKRGIPGYSHRSGGEFVPSTAAEIAERIRKAAGHA